MRQHILLLVSGVALLSGCATKNYVRENVDPLQTKIDQVAQQVNKARSFSRRGSLFIR
jgi:outer membrane biogenesis lipoprotein LolB